MRPHSIAQRHTWPVAVLLWGLGIGACTRERAVAPCRDHAECASHVCSLDVCAECGRDTDCDAGQLCVAGSSTKCARDADCALSEGDGAPLPPAAPDVTAPTDAVWSLALRQ